MSHPWILEQELKITPHETLRLWGTDPDTGAKHLSREASPFSSTFRDTITPVEPLLGVQLQQPYSSALNYFLLKEEGEFRFSEHSAYTFQSFAQGDSLACHLLVDTDTDLRTGCLMGDEWQQKWEALPFEVEVVPLGGPDFPPYAYYLSRVGCLEDYLFSEAAFDVAYQQIQPHTKRMEMPLTPTERQIFNEPIRTLIGELAEYYQEDKPFSKRQCLIELLLFGVPMLYWPSYFTPND